MAHRTYFIYELWPVAWYLLCAFLHSNDKMAEVNLLMTTLLNSATQNNLFLQGQSFNGQVGGRTKLIESNNVNDGTR